MTAAAPSGTRFAIYARYSTVHQHFKSIEDQIRICQEYGARHGWIETCAFHDAERSGMTFEGRAGFFEMMASANRGEFEVLVVEDLDRLSRQASGAHGVVEELEFLDIRIYTVGSGAVSDMEVAFKAVQNANYVRNLAAKSRRGVEGTVKSGLQSGRVPYGYRKVFSPDGKNGLREIVPSEAVIVQRIMSDYVAGVSPLAICRALNAEGVPGPGGRPWRSGAIYGSKAAKVGILRNKLYAGVNEWGRTAVKQNRHKGTKVAKPVSTAQWVRVDVPELRIVDDELFKAVQERLRTNESPQFFKKRRPDYLLTGLCFCGVCGSRYHVLSDKLGCTGRNFGKDCDNRRRVGREDLERVVLSGLKDRLLQEGLIEPFVAEYRAEVERAVAERCGRAESAALRAKELDRQIENIMAQVRDGKVQGLAAQLLCQDLDKLAAERQQLEGRSKGVDVEGPIVLDTSSIVSRLHVLVDDLRDALGGDDANAVRAREVLRGLISRVVIDPIVGDRADGRGIGPVRITIEGNLSALLDLTDQSRVIQHRSRPETLLDHANLTFKYYVDFFPMDSRLLPHGYDDIVTVSHALDDADGPITKLGFVDALAAEADVKADYTPGGHHMKRVESAVEYLLRRGKIRCVHARHLSGYVWNHIALTDEEWKAKAAALPPRTHVPLPVVRMTPPDAYVVSIGRGIESG